MRNRIAHWVCRMTIAYGGRPSFTPPEDSDPKWKFRTAESGHTKSTKQMRNVFDYSNTK
jgi:hypothetical protein